MAIVIYVDFNTMMTDPLHRVYISEEGADDPEDQEVLKVLKPGLPIVLYDETMQVEAIAEFDPEQGVWFGQPKWATKRDLTYTR